jgi:hypothetical protein
MRLHESADGYDYICTHVDDFKIIAKHLEHWGDMVKGTFLIKESGEPNYYLGNNYEYHTKQDLWTVGAATFTKESICCVESEFGQSIRHHSLPLMAGMGTQRLIPCLS